jgi:hypothetical protein
MLKTATKLSPLFVAQRAYPWPLCYRLIRLLWRCICSLQWRLRATISAKWLLEKCLLIFFGIIIRLICRLVLDHLPITDEAKLVVCLFIVVMFIIAYDDRKQRAEENKRRIYLENRSRAQRSFSLYTNIQTEECLDGELQNIRSTDGSVASSYFLECLLLEACLECKPSVARWAVRNGARGVDPFVYHGQSALEFAIYYDTTDADLTRLLLFECGVPIGATTIYCYVTDSVKRALLAAVISRPYDPRDPMAAFDSRTLKKQVWHNRWENPRDAIPRVIHRNTSLLILHSTAQAIIDDRLRLPPERYPEVDVMQRCDPGAGKDNDDTTWMGHLPDELLLIIAQRVACTSHYTESAANVVRLAATCRRWRRLAADKAVVVDVVANSHTQPLSWEAKEHTEWVREYVSYPWSWIYTLGAAAVLRNERRVRELTVHRLPNAYRHAFGVQ